MGEYELDDTLSFLDNGVEDGARLQVQVNPSPNADQVLAELVALNPQCSSDFLERQLERDSSNGIISWSLWGRGLTSLPDSFGRLVIKGRLDLGNNELTALPPCFGTIQVGGELDLADNQLASLPDSFSTIRVGWNNASPSDLYLWGNQLTSLPKGFGRMGPQVSGKIHLARNPLALEGEVRSTTESRIIEEGIPAEKIVWA